MRILAPLLLFACVPALAAPRLDSSTRDYDQHHVIVELTDLRIRQGQIGATATISLTPTRRGGLRLVRLHAVGLEVASVTLAGAAARDLRPAALRLKHRTVGRDELHVSLPRVFRKGERMTLVIGYRATPRKGLHFIRPDHAYPRRPLQVWSQGEAIDNRHWIPCYDLPDDRLTSELIVHAPKGLQVISNGRLVAQQENRWHWKLERAHVSYLITLVVGRFETLEDRWGDVRIRSFFPAGRAAEGRNAFGRTAKMMQFFSERVGRYPWPHYDQLVVHDFLYGGMENTGATTLNARALHDDRARLDYSADNLVAHELAHQWFGNVVTCRTFDHIWLNEGFATYMAELWAEKHLGREAFLVLRRQSLRGVIARSPVPQRFRFRRGRPSGLSGGPAYSRGAALLHLLRNRLGDAAFFKAVRAYLAACSDRSVDTETFRKALEASCGTKLARFFDDWVYTPGVPELRFFWDYSPERSAVQVAVTQLQTHRTYHLDLPVLLMMDGGRFVEKTLPIRGRDHIFTFPVDKPVIDLVVDPQSTVPVQVDNSRETRGWIRLAGHPTLHLVRLAAVEQLAVRGAAGRATLIRALAGDRLWQVRRAAARALGRVGGAAAIEALLGALSARHARVRRAAVESLGRLKVRSAVPALYERLAGDRSYWVQAAAVVALARIKPAGLFEKLVALLPQVSYRDRLRAALLGALTDPRVIPFATRYAVYGAPNSRPTRRAALRCLNRLRKGRPAVERLMLSYLFDPDHRIRRQLLGIVDKHRIEAAAEAVAALARKDPRADIRRRAAEVSKRLDSGAKKK